jgi:acyl-CoA synthetase (AMP-forming)/AMP-acid ligase II
MLAAIRSGATLVILEDPNPFLLQRLRAIEVLARERITVFPGVPFVFRLLAEISDNADLSELRLCYSAGTALPAEIHAAFQARFGVAVRQLYGCTEAGAIAINLDPDPATTSASVGLPIQGVQVKIVDEARHPVPADAVGEIAISTSAMTHGYHGMDDHNRQVFQDGFFYTGDLGRFDAAGRLWITGRKRFHGGDRMALPVVERGDGRIKFNPLANWDKSALDAYMDRHDLPAHPLVEHGYPSVGCWPCTQPVEEGQDVRAGRWAGSEKTECGIHVARTPGAVNDLGGDI